MEETWCYFIYVFSFLFTIFISKLMILNKNRLHKNHPPNPPSLPIIGHLHLLKVPLHRALQNLSFKYGPIFSLRLGSRPAIVISSPSAVEECFTKNDIIFANRPYLINGKYIHYNYTTIVSAPYGRLWHNLRRVAALSMFSNSQLNKYLGIRQDEAKSLTKNLFQESAQSFTKVEMRSRLKELNFNIVMRVIAGKQYVGADTENFEDAKPFNDILADVIELTGSLTIEDFLPFLRRIDFWGTEKRMRKLRNDSDEFFQGLIDEHRKKDGISLPHMEFGKSENLIDDMLSLQQSEPDYYSDDIIKGIIMILAIAGTDSASLTLEWGMSLLLNNGTVLAKARAELDEYLGHDRLLEESDLPKLPYLQGIVNETMRLFPVGPLLVPHESSADCKIGGYDVPRGTMLLVNAWAIQRDPEVWEDPTSFKPERFEGEGGLGGGYKLIQFGMGRRQCPGLGLANKVMGLALGSLIQCFEWERVSEELVDMTEGEGLAMPMKKPLEAMCRTREEMITVLSEL